MEKKRIDYIDWDTYFMGIAKLSAMRSKDPHTQVGACIITSTNRLLSTGYNGAPHGFSDDLIPWDKDGSFLETKYAYVCHAEMNAILNFKGNTFDLEGSKIYVDLFPCNECAKLIVQAGIKEVIYLSDKYHDKDYSIASRKIFDECNIIYRQFRFKKDVVLNLTN